MKQQITEDQLKEINAVQYALLHSWMATKGYILVWNHPPLLTIGQMIEFLSDHYKEIGLGFNDSGVFWTVKVGGRGCGSMMHGFGKDYDSNDSEDGNDLVAPLWEAVKEVLVKDLK